MLVFAGKVAVITGAASGIGRAIAERCGREGMRIVLADIEQQSLSQTEASIRASGATVRSVLVDVSKADQVNMLARVCHETFGGVHLLCNLAGVLHVSPIWDTTTADWEWVLGVNLWGVIHGVRAFVPMMLAQDSEAHIVNMASTAGLNTGPGMASYKVSKHAVIALSEVLYYELAEKSAKVRVSVLCPGWVDTQIMDAERNRPHALRNDAPASPESNHHKARGRQSAKSGATPASIADCMFEAIRDGRFYVLPNLEFKERFLARSTDILHARNPTAGQSFAS